MDVTDKESVRAGVAHVLSAEGTIDVVVNNAGYSLAGPIEDTPLEDAQRQLDTNFFGVVRVIQTVLPHMRERRSGKIINISSLGGLVGMPFQAFYSASKFALEGLTEALRLELAPFGIEVANVNPGDIRTPMTANRVTAAAAGNGTYAEQFARTLQIYERDERHGAEAILVAQLVDRLIETKSPHVRYLVGLRAQTMLTRLKHFIGSRRFEKMMMDHCRIRMDS
jgi:NAD(P)-dependent dehydrogenase (short-subunit alcohol dehydrogenase family)